MESDFVKILYINFKILINNDSNFNNFYGNNDFKRVFRNYMRDLLFHPRFKLRLLKSLNKNCWIKKLEKLKIKNSFCRIERSFIKILL